MKKRFKKYWRKDLLGPTISKAIPRLFLSFLVMILWHQLINTDQLMSPFTWVSPALFLVFVTAAWFIFLRFDGMRFPRFFRRDTTRPKKNKHRGDIIDYVDEDANAYDELQQDEQDFCCMMADLFCAVLFLVLSFI